MAKNNNLNDFIYDLLEEVRASYNINTLINPQDVTKIIRTKGKENVYGDVTFFDTDGCVLYAYTWDEFRNIEGMPELPRTEEWEGCPTRWSHTREQILKEKNKCNVMLHSTGYRSFIVSVKDGETVTIRTMHTSSFSTIYWGDGSSDDMTIEAYFSGRVARHTYSRGGVYQISISADINFDSMSYTAIDKSVLKAIGSFYGHNTGAVTHNKYGLCNIKFNRFCGSIEGTCYRYFRYSSAPIVLLSNGGYGNIINGVMRDAYVDDVVFSSISTDNLKITDEAFYRSYIHRIVIPEKTVTVNGNSFVECPYLKTVYFPSTINEVSLSAFNGCNSLEVLDFKMCDVIPTCANIFTNITTLPYIVVPDSLYDEWVAADKWSTYADKIIKASEYTEE